MSQGFHTLSSPKEDIIQKNLEPLKENIRKKKRAQQAYYQNHNDHGVSPLTRTLKRPVHQRLGRTVPYTLGTNTSAIPPKRRLRRMGNEPLYNRRTRIFSAQQRLNHIRAKHREVNNFQNTPKRIKLRRTLPQLTGGPTNLTVEFKNNNAFSNKKQFNQGVRRFRQILNSQLQLEIKKIQMDFEGGQPIMPMRVTPSSTKKSLNMRFADLS